MRRAAPLSFANENRIDVGPHQPMLVELCCPVSRVRTRELSHLFGSTSTHIREASCSTNQRAIKRSSSEPTPVMRESWMTLIHCNSPSQAYRVVRWPAARPITVLVYQHETRSRCSCLRRIQLTPPDIPRCGIPNSVAHPTRLCECEPWRRCHRVLLICRARVKIPMIVPRP